MKSKLKHFLFVYDTKSETDDVKRHDSLRDSLKNIFPNHYINVFIYHKRWTRSHTNIKDAAYFTKEYGSDVDIVLS